MLVLWADKDAPDWTGPIKLTATGKTENAIGPRGLRARAEVKAAPITREVRPYTRVWNSTDLNSSRPTRELVVAIAGESAPCSRVTPAVERDRSGGGEEG